MVPEGWKPRDANCRYFNREFVWTDASRQGVTRSNSSRRQAGLNGSPSSPLDVFWGGNGKLSRRS